MTEGADWQPTFDRVSQIPGEKTSGKRRTEADFIAEAAKINRGNASTIAVSMGAVDTGDDFDPYEWLAENAEDTQDAIDGLDGRVTSLEGATVDVAALTHAATSKTTPVDADELALVDSAASNVLKKLSWANLKATLAADFARVVGVPAGASATGAAPSIAYDGSYIYVCVATDTWLRAPIATW